MSHSGLSPVREGTYGRWSPFHTQILMHELERVPALASCMVETLDYLGLLALFRVTGLCTCTAGETRQVTLNCGHSTGQATLERGRAHSVPVTVSQADRGGTGVPAVRTACCLSACSEPTLCPPVGVSQERSDELSPRGVSASLDGVREVEPRW